MAQELQEPSVLRYSYIFEFLPGVILLILIIYGVILFVKSRWVSSKSLKVGILLPLIAVGIGLLWWIGSLIDILDFGTYIIFGMMGGWFVISIISVIFSIVALVKIERKSLAIGSLIYGMILFLIWLISILTFEGI